MKSTKHTYRKPIKSRQESPSPGDYSLPSAFSKTIVGNVNVSADKSTSNVKGFSFAPLKNVSNETWREGMKDISPSANRIPGPGSYFPKFKH